MAIPDLMSPIEAEMDARGWTGPQKVAALLAFTKERQYQKTLEDGSANPQDRREFASAELVALFRQGAKAWITRKAMKDAGDAVPDIDL